MGKTQRAQEFDRVMDNVGETLPEKMAEGIVQDYPYFVLPRVLMLQRNKELTLEQQEKLTTWLAAAMADRSDLYDLVGDMAEKFRGFYPHEEQEPKASTTDTISRFLDIFGGNDEQELKAIEQRIFNPVPDYAQLLEKEAADREEKKSEEIVAAKAEKQSEENAPLGQPEEGEKKSKQEVRVAMSPDSSGDSLLSESLAKIYIRQHRYDKALEIIQSLSLNFPEKSIYFADQIRFLKKLILNQEYKTKKQ